MSIWDKLRPAWLGERTGATPAAPVAVAERSFGTDVPDKVFIERQSDGNYEYSADDPRIAEFIDGLFEGYYGDQNFMELFYALPEVFAPIHEIASRVSSAVWVLKKNWNNEVDSSNADFNRLFTSPNPLESFNDFIYRSVCYELLTGKQFFYVNRPASLAAMGGLSSVVAWWNLPAHRTVADLRYDIDPYTATKLSDFIIGYRSTINGRGRTFEPNNVLPLCNINLAHSADINRSRSQLLGARMAIRNLVPVYIARGTIYIKRGALGFLVSKKSDESGLRSLTKSEKEQALKDFDGTYGVTPGKSPVGLTAMPLEWVRTAMSIQELQPFDETIADAIAIYATLRVPRHLVPSKDRSTFANANQDMKSFYSDTIIPMAKRYAQAWTNFFALDAERRYIDVDFSHVDVLQDDKKQKAVVDATNGNTYLQRWLSGVWSLNQWLIAIGEAKGTGPLYEKKLFELTPEELIQVQAVINLKGNVNPQQDPASPDSGAQAPGAGDQPSQP